MSVAAADEGRSARTFDHREQLQAPAKRRSLSNAVRIDKWLWAARFFKTRSAATEAVLGGRVHVDDERVKPSREVRPGDVVEISIRDLGWTVVVRDVAERRGPAAVAKTLYEESPE